jgi:hypothetical protein
LEQPVELSLEQQFELRSFQDQVEHMSREQCVEMLPKLYKAMMERENAYKQMLKQEWGIGK